jgi:hypothetical protein
MIGRFEGKREMKNKMNWEEREWAELRNCKFSKKKKNYT